MADGLVALGKAFEPPPVHEKDVEPVVLVVVEEGRAAAGGFEQILVAMFAAEDGLDVQAGFFRHIDKLHAQRRSGHRREAAPLGAGRAGAS